MHRPEDVEITYIGKPVVTGYREQTDNKFWRVPIEAPQDEMPNKLALVDQLLLSKLPPVSREQVSEAKEIAHNLHEILSLSQGIMHAVCGYPAKSTWVKAIWTGNFAGWPLLTAKKIYTHYPITNKTPMGHLN